MKIGKSEKIVLSLIKKYPDLNETTIQLLLQLITGRKHRLIRIISNLRRKNLIDKKHLVVTNINKIANQLLQINFEKEVEENIDSLNNFKLGRRAKTILYILGKINRASLQFLAMCSKESIKNTFAVLKRLEENGLAYGYSSRIPYRNSRGRRYRPKYYGITTLGTIIIKTKSDTTIDYDKIDELLSNLQSSLADIKENFQVIKT